MFTCEVCTYLYRSLKSSFLAKASAAASGSLCCIDFRLSAFKARQPCRNSVRVNLHICSALHFQAKTRTQNSSGRNSKSCKSASVPGTKMASSQSRYLSKREFILGSDPDFSEDPERPNGGIRGTKLRLSPLWWWFVLIRSSEASLLAIKWWCMPRLEGFPVLWMPTTELEGAESILANDKWYPGWSVGFTVQKIHFIIGGI